MRVRVQVDWDDPIRIVHFQDLVKCRCEQDHEPEKNWKLTAHNRWDFHIFQAHVGDQFVGNIFVEPWMRYKGPSHVPMKHSYTVQPDDLDNPTQVSILTKAWEQFLTDNPEWESRFIEESHLVRQHAREIGIS